MMRESSQDRLKKLELIERDLTTALSSAGQALSELAKDKPSVKVLETNATNFLREITKVEAELNEQIQYLAQVSSGQAHEGSSYASQKVVAMAWHRLEHTKTRLSELERVAPPTHPPMPSQIMQNRPPMPPNPPMHPSQGMHPIQQQPQMMQNQMQQPQQQQPMQQHVPLPPPQLQPLQHQQQPQQPPPPQQQPPPQQPQQMLPQQAGQMHPHQMHYNM